jgi:hypothetical protein
MHTLAYFMLGLGIALLVAGILIGGVPKIPPPVWSVLLGGLGLMAAADWGRRSLKEWAWDRRLRRAHQQESEFVASLTPQLLGEYVPYVIEAAEQLGEARDPTAVPALMSVLENCVDLQRPSWKEISEVVVKALSKIGDRRSLALLYRIENVRGIGIITEIRAAIAAIEPQTSLLRPGGLETTPEMLLRPAQGRQTQEESALLLRAVESDPR